MMDGPVWMGPAIMVNDLQGLLLRHSFLLGLRVHSAEQWSSVEALSNQLPQVIYQSMHHCVEPAP